jgi:internalin A
LYWEPGGKAPQGELELNLICEMRQNPPPGIVPQMIVACHPFRYKETQPLDSNWQRGAFFDRGRIGTALMELKDRELWLTVRNGHPDYFLHDLRKTLEKRIADVWPGLDYRLVVPCPTPTESGFCEGRFQLKALQDALADGDKTYRCQECGTKQPIEPLLKGMDYSSLSELARLMEALHSNQQNAFSLSLDLYRRLLVAIGTETKEAPCMFTLFASDTPGAMQRHQLTLWCEWSDSPHPCCPIGSGGEGDYSFERPKEWYTHIAPYLNALSRMLKVFAPIAIKAGEVVWSPDAVKEWKPGFDLAEKAGGLLPAGDSRKSGGFLGKTFRAEGEALRAIHDVLREVAPKKGRKWGGLERKATRSGEYIWLCEKHAREYDPGLPKLD